MRKKRCMPESWGTYYYMGLQTKPGKLSLTKRFLVQVRTNWQRTESSTLTIISVHASFQLLCPSPVDRRSDGHSTVKKFKGPTPTMSSHSPQPRFYELKSTILRLLKESPGSHEAAKDHVSTTLIMSSAWVAHSQIDNVSPFSFLEALVRDGYRCLVTGNGERSMAQHNLKLKEDVMASRASIVSTQCAHIFDSSTNRNLGKEGSTKVSPSFFAVV